MAALPLAVFGGSPLERLVRLLRAGATSAGSEGGSPLESRWAALRLREDAGGGCEGGGGGGGGGFGSSPLAEPADRLAAERVTLDDMIFWLKTLHARWLRQTEAPTAEEVEALPVEAGEAVAVGVQRARQQKREEAAAGWRGSRVGSYSYLLSRWRSDLSRDSDAIKPWAAGAARVQTQSPLVGGGC